MQLNIEKKRNLNKKVDDKDLAIKKSNYTIIIIYSNKDMKAMISYHKYENI